MAPEFSFFWSKYKATRCRRTAGEGVTNGARAGTVVREVLPDLSMCPRQQDPEKESMKRRKTLDQYPPVTDFTVPGPGTQGGVHQELGLESFQVHPVAVSKWWMRPGGITP